MNTFMSILFLIGLLPCISVCQETYVLPLNHSNNLVNSKVAQTPAPIESIRLIYSNYDLHQQYTDTEENLKVLTESLAFYENNEISQKGLTLIINLWMYYTVVDFPTLELTERVLFAHREESIVALKTRIINKEEWETIDGAPYADLSYLLEELEEAGR